MKTKELKRQSLSSCRRHSSMQENDMDSPYIQESDLDRPCIEEGKEVVSRKSLLLGITLVMISNITYLGRLLVAKLLYNSLCLSVNP